MNHPVFKVLQIHPVTKINVERVICMMISPNKFGPLRTFSTEDTLNTLFFLENGPIARKQLSEMLELGEGATRTIIKLLTTQNLIQTVKKGCVLTTLGKKELDENKRQISLIKPIPPSDLTYNQNATCLILKNHSKNVSNGLEERDTAIKAGSNGATILVTSKKGVLFPDSSTLANNPNLPQTTDGDVLIITYGPKQRKAAIAVALNVIKKRTSR